MIITRFVWTLWSLLLYSVVCLAGASLRASAGRSLQEEEVVTLLMTGDGFHTVRVRQTFVGTPGTCEDGEENTASFFFATYLDPDLLEETCGFFERNVGGCFTKTVTIGCDPNTNTATIHLYIRDESFPISYKTDSGTACSRDRWGDTLGRSMKVTETFPCGPQPLGNDFRPNTCSNDYDNCEEGFYCTYDTIQGHYCQAFVPVGSTCEGIQLQDPFTTVQVCDPERAYCHLPHSCTSPQDAGICTAFAGDCTDSSECGPTEFCEDTLQKCVPQLQVGDCCHPDAHHACEDGFCNLDASGAYRCKAYTPVGSPCGGRALPGQESYCDPDHSYCYSPDSCQISDATGECVAFTGDQCQSHSDCDSDSYCDVHLNKCKPTHASGECCEPDDDHCVDGYFCKVIINFESRCTAYTPVGGFCGGRTRLGEGGRCDPDKAYCFEPTSCIFKDKPGQCLAYLGDCTKDSDCGTGEYCNEQTNIKKCMARLKDGMCCDPKADQCMERLVCRSDVREAGIKCRRPLPPF